MQANGTQGFAFVYCLLFTFFSAEAVLGTTEAVSTELLAEAV